MMLCIPQATGRKVQAVDVNVGQAEIDNIKRRPPLDGRLYPSKQKAGTANHTSGIANYFPADDAGPLVPSIPAAPLPPPWPPCFSEIWPMQKFASEMVEFAEELHRSLQRVPVNNGPHGSVLDGVARQFTQLEHNLTNLLARNGIGRDDPRGSMFDLRYHQQLAEQESLSDAPGTVVQTRTSTWTLNDRLLRPATVIVSAARTSERGSDKMADANKAHASIGFVKGQFV